MPVQKKKPAPTKKKTTAPPAASGTQKKEEAIGEVVHFFSNIKVAVLKVTKPLALGDTIRIVGGEDTDFTQKVTSLEQEHEKIKKAKKGSEVGTKMSKKVREGYKVYKVN